MYVTHGIVRNHSMPLSNAWAAKFYNPTGIFLRSISQQHAIYRSYSRVLRENSVRFPSKGFDNLVGPSQPSQHTTSRTPIASNHNHHYDRNENNNKSNCPIRKSKYSPELTVITVTIGVINDNNNHNITNKLVLINCSKDMFLMRVLMASEYNSNTFILSSEKPPLLGRVYYFVTYFFYSCC